MISEEMFDTMMHMIGYGCLEVNFTDAIDSCDHESLLELANDKGLAVCSDICPTLIYPFPPVTLFIVGSTNLLNKTKPTPAAIDPINNNPTLLVLMSNISTPK